jgi:hypothetical protein
VSADVAATQDPRAELHGPVSHAVSTSLDSLPARCHKHVMRSVLLSGSSHPALAADIATALGTPLGALTVERFPDGELDVEQIGRAHV